MDVEGEDGPVLRGDPVRLQDLHLGGREVTRKERSLEVTSLLLNLHFETKLDILPFSVFLSDLSDF